ncbi:MAG: gluconate 2-dehydrogenase subunit 3 family protein, partial [Bacteroidota bacterium]
MMNRRDALKALSLATGGALTGAALSWTGCKTEPTVFRFFKPEDTETLDAIGETILPTTEDSPGAGEIGISEFIDIYAADCLKSSHQDALRAGFAERLQPNLEGQTDFTDLTPQQQYDLLLALDEEAILYNENLQPLQPPHYFSILKNIILFGYFSSEAGAKQALRYLPIPGRYEGDFPFQSGDKAWAI